MTAARLPPRRRPLPWGPRTALLVSARSLDEARAAAPWVDLLDLKEPAAGALGGLAPELLRDIVAALEAEGSPRPWISATVGDWQRQPAEADANADTQADPTADPKAHPHAEPSLRLDALEARCLAVAASGVDWVKVGVPCGALGRAAARALRRLAAQKTLQTLRPQGLQLVPVLLVDDDGTGDDAVPAVAPAARIDAEVLELLLPTDAPTPFPAVMLDTQHKAVGSLLTRLDVRAWAAFAHRVRAAGAAAGLSGALRPEDLPLLRQWAPDFAGFRSAVCAAGRAAALDAARVRALAEALHPAVPLPNAIQQPAQAAAL